MDKAQKLPGSDVLLSCLEKSGVELLLGYTGGAIMPTFDALQRFPNLRFITSRHEQGAGFIAGGYTRACGKLAPVMVTSGPGATNLITAVADSKMDSVPMLAITGQVNTEVIGTDAFQESDIVGIMYPCTKFASMPLSSDELALTIGQSIYIATHGRPGPVCIDLPKNVQQELTNNIEIPEDLDLPGFELPNLPKKADLEIAAKIINKAKRPVILAGHGIILSQSQNELQTIMEKTQIPAAFTVHGLSSIPASNALNLGMMGMHGEIEANRAIQNADVLIALGMRFDDRVTGKISEFGKNQKIIHVEVDPSEIGKNVAVDASINADLKETLIELEKLIEVKTTEDRLEFFQTIEENKLISRDAYSRVFKKGYGQNNRLLMARVVHELSEFTNGNDNVVSDVGQHQMFTAKFYKFERFNTWFNSGGLGTMGFSLPTAIGVKLARPDEEVWSINGDGGFQMNIQELGTIKQENLNINILILNNEYLGMVKQWQDLFYKKNYAQTELINPDFEHIAKAYGLAYKKVEKVEEIIPALEWSKFQTGSTIVEFLCDKSELVFPMISTSMSYDQMILHEEDARSRVKE
ncbi:MAG: biosynthetic-type acetolactate synthase large subunit [bacterium]